jgi:hypothetical protein
MVNILYRVYFFYELSYMLEEIIHCCEHENACVDFKGKRTYTSVCAEPHNLVHIFYFSYHLQNICHTRIVDRLISTARA